MMAGVFGQLMNDSQQSCTDLKLDYCSDQDQTVAIIRRGCPQFFLGAKSSDQQGQTKAAFVTLSIVFSFSCLQFCRAPALAVILTCWLPEKVHTRAPCDSTLLHIDRSTFFVS